MEQQTLPSENENANNITEVCENLNSDQDTDRTSSTFDFTRNTGNTDLIIVVEGTQLHVSKHALVLASPVFEKMFQQDFKEKSVTELELPGKRLTDVLEFLRCIYPTTLTQVNRDNVLQILPLVEEYQVFQLKPSCEQILLDMLDENTSALRLYEILKEACLFGLQKVRAKCVEMAAGKSKEELNDAKSKIKPPADALNEVLDKINERLELKLEDLDSQLKQAAKECQILKFYWSQHARKSNIKAFDGTYNWKDSSVLLMVDIGKPCEVNITCWNVTVKVSFESRQKNDRGWHMKNDWFCVDITHLKTLRKCDVWSKVLAYYVLINRFGNDESLTFWQDTTFQKGQQHVSQELVKLDSINKFGADGKICVFVNIFMTEPIPLEE